MRVDIAVVGGGIAGIGVAAELSGDGASIVVLEQENGLARHSSGRSAAAFLESYGSPAIRALTRASRPLFDERDAGRPPVLTPRPLIWVGDADNVSTVEALVAGEPLLRGISSEQARALCRRKQHPLGAARRTEAIGTAAAMGCIEIGLGADSPGAQLRAARRLHQPAAVLHAFARRHRVLAHG